METANEEPELFSCKVHGPLPLDQFQPSNVKRKVHMCKACIAKRNATYYRSDRFTLGMVRAEMKRRQAPAPLPEHALRSLLEKHGFRCALTGAAGKLTLLQLDASKPITEEGNAVPVLKALVSKCRRSAAAEAEDGEGAYVIGAPLLFRWVMSCR